MKWSSLTWLQNKTGRRYLHSYLLISIIPVICICMVYCAASVFTLRRQAEETMQAQLEQLQRELDANITFMENSANHLSNLLSAQESPPEANERVEMLVRQLNTYKANFQLPCEILYYPRSGTEVITPDGQTDYYSFQKAGPWRDELDMIQFYTRLNRAQSRAFMTTRGMDGESGSFLVYLSPISNLDVTPVGSIAFMVEKPQIDLLVEGFLGDFGGYLLIYDAFYGLAYEYDQCGQYITSEVTKSLVDTTGGGGGKFPKNL